MIDLSDILKRSSLFRRKPFYTPNEDKNIPSVFISYSHFTEEHICWVVGFAEKLSQLNISVAIDANLNDSRTFPAFMSCGSLKKYVVCVCSESYVEKVLNKEKPTGSSWEFDRIIDRSIDQPMGEFIIPIHKDSSKDPKKKFIQEIKGIQHYNFETEEEAYISFAKIAWRFLEIDQIFSKITFGVPEEVYLKNKMFKFIHDQLSLYWLSESQSKEEQILLREILSGDIYKIERFIESSSSPSLGKYQISEEKVERIANLIGKWDISHDGDTTAFTDLM